ncbi:hypothetical protein I4U23_023064 [Adineta vaga]|nr:hypothetical protein I4U23_023064 [Adineta vaga]
MVGVNEKLNRLACDISFTRFVDLMTIEPNGMIDLKFNPILNRFCKEILPRIRCNVESLTLHGYFLPRVLHSTNYVGLRKLVMINLEMSMACQIFNEKTPFIQVLKQQISDIVLTIDSDILGQLNVKLFADTYNRIFVLFTNLKYLDIDTSDTYVFSGPLLTSLSSPICYSSSIVHLRIKMQNIDDCIYLLDGRLSQLKTSIIILTYVHNPVQIRLRSQRIIRHSLKIMDNMTNLIQLKCFSIHAYHRTAEFDSLVVPLLRRMTHLEQLTLSLRVAGKGSIIDGTYLNNYILSQMPRLHTFHFDIVNECVRIDQEHPKPTPDDIRHGFKQSGYDVDCYIDYGFHPSVRCHVYSLAFPLERICPITHNFPGGMFINIRVLRLKDWLHPFEHSFFAQISRSFPLLSRLIISNGNEQKEKHVDKPSIIEFSHLVELEYCNVHIDYVEQFLVDSNAYLPCLNKIYISYGHLASITENFTRIATRMNCAKLKHYF